MIMKLIFATNNQHKVCEVQAIAGNKISLLTLKEVNFFEEIPEEMPTLEGNSLQKAQYIYDRLQQNCFADDTGLEIEALNNEPGVYSARYAGEGCSFEDNVNKVLDKMKGIANRKCCFRCIFTLIVDGEITAFEGRINGLIAEEAYGTGGFGYDPIFIPDGYDKTFAELPIEVKNEVSHRALAATQMFDYIKQKYGSNE